MSQTALLSSLLLQLQTDADIAYHCRDDCVHELNDCDLGPQATPDRAHFQANVPSSNNCHVLWHLFEEQCTC